MKKSVLILLSACLTISFGACKNTPSEQKQETKTDTKTTDDGKSDAQSDSKSDDDSQSDAQSDCNSDDSQSDAASDTDNTDVETTMCAGPASYKDMAGYGKVKLGYPCNIDEDCEGYVAGVSTIVCSADAYFCEDYINGSSTVEAKDIPNFYPCFNDAQCASGHCLSVEENLNFCVPSCKEGDQDDGNFVCQGGSAGFYCHENLERESVKVGASCIHELYDCGWNMECYNGTCSEFGE